MKLIPLNLPPANLKLTKKDNLIYVFCIIRKKQLVLTPEEWVRQHIIHYLIYFLNTPIGYISTETGISINKLERRTDIIVYGKDKKVKLLVECKAPSVPINEKVLHQIANYNSKIMAPYLWLSNGIDHKIFKIDHQQNKTEEISEIPNFNL
jgi:hypothetical protein